jgi:hypothetical protein
VNDGTLRGLYLIDIGQTVTAGKKTSDRGDGGGMDDGLYLIDIADSDGREGDL